MFYKIASLIICLSGCASSVPPYNPSPKQSSSEDTVTVGYVCAALGTAGCNRLSECNAMLDESVSDCAVKFFHKCCVDAECARKHPATKEEVRQCAVDIGNASCHQMAAPHSKGEWIPKSCQEM